MAWENCSNQPRELSQSYSKLSHSAFVSCWQRIVISQPWFLEDGATRHTANATQERLTHKFGETMIS